MTARRLKPEERFEARRNAMIAFHGRMSDPEEERAESLGETTEAWGTFREDGRLMASLTDYSYLTWFDGHAVKTGGVSEVAAFPEFRGQGAVRRLFEAFLPAAGENGEILSTLCPLLPRPVPEIRIRHRLPPERVHHEAGRAVGIPLRWIG